MTLRLLSCSVLALAAFAADAPRPGRYRCFSYGAAGATPIFIGYLELKGGGVYEWAKAAGRYRFDSAGGSVVWESGPAKAESFGGTFEVQGKTHKIRLKPRTVCMNTPE